MQDYCIVRTLFWDRLISCVTTSHPHQLYVIFLFFCCCWITLECEARAPIQEPQFVKSTISIAWMIFCNFAFFGPKKDTRAWVGLLFQLCSIHCFADMIQTFIGPAIFHYFTCPTKQFFAQEFKFMTVWI